jgi:putative ABC transport system permease protein
MQDLRLALRSLRSTPVVTTVACLSLALGIGANTAIFSLVDTLLLRTLPVEAPQRLAQVVAGPTSNPHWPYVVWAALRERAQPFAGVLAWSQQPVNLAEGGETQPAEGLYASGEYFATLGVPALLGRTFTAADDVRGGGPDGAVAVLSYVFWQRRFGGTAAVIGTSLTIERVPFTIIGVTPPGFFGTEIGRAFDVALPIGTEPLIRGKDTSLDLRGNYWLQMMVRLTSSQSIEAATGALRHLQPEIREAAMPGDLLPRFQATFLQEPFSLVPASTGSSPLRERYERPLVTILVVAGLVLCIACD